ncbi:stromal interaction molecule homolog isoform X3 [Rhipicephalus sanguineus]|uniref:stromal interaction molecule homolog isoform X3 n=1 Tax=Rhipicephalus sanguineus TaxID=34632 RepID=UPI0018957F0F|nr:stromal interaction molecule homolog isoform X3 [Rhipicephalus sanguineus]
MNWLRPRYIVTVFLFSEVVLGVLLVQDRSANALTADKDATDSAQGSAPTADDKGSTATCEKVNACDDLLGYEAIRALHQQLDDDDNGSVDIAETDEFLRDELQYENGYERQKKFHGNDKYISIEELWQSWQVSEVHNWTVEETIEWLVSCVELPQYAKTFEENAVDGSTLPRMAVANNNYLSSVLGIKDVIHKQKLTLKAMDVVLFGPPKHHNYIKDVLLVLSLVIAIGGCWFAYVQHNYSQLHLKKMMKDMDSLQRAEEQLSELQRELDKAKMEQETAVIQKQRLEDEILAAKQERELWSTTDPDQTRSIVECLQDEVRTLREQLSTAQAALSSAVRSGGAGAWVPPPSLQHWLQLTHELESRHYNSKKAAAEKQLLAAKEGCEKLRKKRGSFMGSFRIAHGSSIDDIDNRILQAKAALSEVTKDLQERLHRWKQIERLCGFSIVNNQGLGPLENMLRGSFLNGTAASSLPHSYSVGKKMSRSGSEGTLAEEESPYGISAVQQLVHNSTALFLASVPPACDLSKCTLAAAAGFPPFRVVPLNSTNLPQSAAAAAAAVSTTASPTVAASVACPNGSVSSVASLLSLRCPERPSTLPIGAAKSNGASSQKLALLDETDDDAEEFTDSSLPTTLSTGTSAPSAVSFMVGDSRLAMVLGSPAEPPQLIRPRSTQLLNKAVSADDAPPRRILTSTELMVQTEPSSPATPESGSAVTTSEPLLLPRPPLTSMPSVERRKKAGKILVAALKGNFSGAIVDEENSTDSNSTADDDSLKEKKKAKASSIFQPLYKKKPKAS